jgi:hypothetical protein
MNRPAPGASQRQAQRALAVVASSGSGGAGLRARQALGTRMPGFRASAVPGKRGLFELLDLRGLHGGHLFDELLHGDYAWLTDLNEIHAGHNILRRWRSQYL